MELKKRFGRLVAAQRKRVGLTQGALAEAAGISVEMISKIETGASGARFAVIERIARALGVDPAELFTTEIPSGALNRGTFAKISSTLAKLSPEELLWVGDLLNAALTTKRGPAGSRRTRVPPPS